MMKRINFFFLAAAAVALQGCLMVDVFDYRITISRDGHHAISESVYHNIRGSEAGDQFEQDFSELMDSWKGNDYVAQRKKEGVTVTSRKLGIEDGVLTGRQITTFSDTSASFKNIFSKDSLRLSFKRKDVDTILRTNGKVRRTRDSTIIVWPRTVKDYRIAMKFKILGEHISFIQKFQEYLKSEQPNPK